MADPILDPALVQGIPAAEFSIDSTYRYYSYPDPFKISAADLLERTKETSNVVSSDVKTPSYMGSTNLIYDTSLHVYHLKPNLAPRTMSLIAALAPIADTDWMVLDTHILDPTNPSLSLAQIKNNELTATIGGVAVKQKVWELQITGGSRTYAQMINTGDAIKEGSLPQICLSKRASPYYDPFNNTPLTVNKNVKNSSYPVDITLPQSFCISYKLFSSPPEIEQSLLSKRYKLPCIYIMLRLKLEDENIYADFLLECDSSGGMTFFFRRKSKEEKELYIPEAFATETGRTNFGDLNKTFDERLLDQFYVVGSSRLKATNTGVSGKDVIPLVFMFTPYGLGIYQGVPPETHWTADWSYDFPRLFSESKPARGPVRSRRPCLNVTLSAVVIGTKFASASVFYDDVIFPVDGGQLKYGPVSATIKHTIDTSSLDSKENIVYKDSTLSLTCTENITLALTPVAINKVGTFTPYFHYVDYYSTIEGIPMQVPSALKGIPPLEPTSVSGSESIDGRSYNLSFVVPPITGNSTVDATRAALQAIQGAYPCTLQFGYKTVGGTWVTGESKTVKGFIWSKPSRKRDAQKGELSFTVVDRSLLLKQQWKACLPIYDGWRGRDIIADVCRRAGFNIPLNSLSGDLIDDTGYGTSWEDQVSFGSLQGPLWKLDQNTPLWGVVEKVAKYCGYWVWVDDNAQIHIAEPFHYYTGHPVGVAVDYQDLVSVGPPAVKETTLKKLIHSISSDTAFDSVYNQVSFIGATPASVYVGMEVITPPLQVLSETFPATPGALKAFISSGSYSAGGYTFTNLLPFPKTLVRTDPAMNSRLKMRDDALKFFQRSAIGYETLSFNCRGFTDRKPIDFIKVRVLAEPTILPDATFSSTTSVAGIYIIANISYSLDGAAKTFTRIISTERAYPDRHYYWNQWRAVSGREY